MGNPRGQAAIEAQRRWQAKHPEYKHVGPTKERQKARLDVIKAINPCYLKEARAMLQGTKTRINRCQKLVGDDCAC
ncbi:hypothetical protein M0R72_19480 [Candidatus Pacearchaeota archaeon]|jgi:hypothetical protein|nr:hypothetical protein [Candidatus Pacearchaeota archaeon]